MLEKIKLKGSKENTPTLSSVKTRVKNEPDEAGVILAPGTGDVEPSECHFREENTTPILLSSPNPIVNFPHPREHCIIHSIWEDPVKVCPSCFCYVCDKPAVLCLHWKSHCVAQHSGLIWQQKRANVKMQKIVEQERLNSRNSSEFPLTPFTAKSTDLHTSISRLNSHLPINNNDASLSIGCIEHLVMKCDDNLATPDNIFSKKEGIEDVSSDEKSYFQPNRISKLAPPSGLHEVISQINPEQIHMPSTFLTILKDYQRYSLEFMVSVENSTVTATFGKDQLGNSTCGGWLDCGEINMCESAIIIALVTVTRSSTSTKIIRFGRKLIKTTVILTSSVALMNRWQSECEKHCPFLNVQQFHPSSRSARFMDLRDFSTHDHLENVDILISTSSFRWPEYITSIFKFSRVVVTDKSQLTQQAIQIIGQRRWCIKATIPHNTVSINDLRLELRFLCMDGENNYGICRALQQVVVFNGKSETKPSIQKHREHSFFALSYELSKHMIRLVHNITNSNEPKIMVLPLYITQLASLPLSQSEKPDICLS